MIVVKDCGALNVWANNVYSSQTISDNLQQRLEQAGIEVYAIDAIIHRGGDRDIPISLGDAWATSWTDQEIATLAALSQADCIDTVYRMLGDHLYSPGTALERATFAATQTMDPDMHAAGQAALAMQDILYNFQKPVYRRKLSPYGDVEYQRIGEIDVETSRAIIEVTTQPSAAGKVAQLQRLLSPERNHFDGIVVIPHGNAPKPVFFYMPGLASVRPAQTLVHAGAAGVYRTVTDLEAAIRSL